MSAFALFCYRLWCSELYFLFFLCKFNGKNKTNDIFLACLFAVFIIFALNKYNS